ncbi:unnamed protein product [Caenorhabditis sp. 36 PRJEB53466]|nr:unnamed protein product [Caenorhabditis sp. 36 PRJEB53466]
MDFVHCNRCYIRKPPGGYLISSCFHICCQNCAETEHKSCPVCKKTVKIVRLNGTINQSIKMYFMDPFKTLTESLEKLQRKINFQTSIRVHLLKHLTKEKEKKRQMEVYFRKKAQEFASQRKKLADANTWILSAEQKLRASEEERLRLKQEYEDLQHRLQSLAPRTPIPSTTPRTTPYSFLMSDGHGSSRMESSPNSTFNMVSPLVNSPAHSLNETNFNNFFDNTALGTAGSALADDTMFGSMSSTNHPRSTLSDTTAFSATFNNMFTPSKDVEMTMVDKTSASLDNWRTHRTDSRATLDISRRETSLPTACPGPTPTHSARPRPSHRTTGIPMEKRPMSDFRRYSSQPGASGYGFLGHRKSINNRGGYEEELPDDERPEEPLF